MPEQFDFESDDMAQPTAADLQREILRQQILEELRERGRTLNRNVEALLESLRQNKSEKASPSQAANHFGERPVFQSGSPPDE